MNEYSYIGMKKLLLLVAALSGLAVQLLTAQTADSAQQAPRLQWLPKSAHFKLQTTLLLQLWSTYSTGFEVYNTQTKTYTAADDRLNISLRRARLVFNGEPYPRLTYTLALFYDQTGYDILSSGVGTTNKDQPSVGLWDAFVQYRLPAKGQGMYLTAGYFRPQMQRESITAAWATTSFEKSMSQNYLRRHLTGTGPGRAMGVNLGGLKTSGQWGLLYNIGVFTPVASALDGSSGGTQFAPLWTGRVSLQLGQAEMSQYKIAYEINYFNKRKGLSLDFNASHQGTTDRFVNSQAYGPGFLFNWGPLNLDGEWMWLDREGTLAATDSSFNARTQTGHIRLGYNFLMGRFILEPSAMVMAFSGAEDAQGQEAARLLGMSSGSERTYDVGCNLYLDRRNFKINLHYTWRSGEPGAAGEGATVNSYFSQPGVGAIRRGDYLGLGLSLIF